MIPYYPWNLDFHVYQSRRSDVFHHIAHIVCPPGIFFIITNKNKSIPLWTDPSPDSPSQRPWKKKPPLTYIFGSLITNLKLKSWNLKWQIQYDGQNIKCLWYARIAGFLGRGLRIWSQNQYGGKWIEYPEIPSGWMIRGNRRSHEIHLWGRRREWSISLEVTKKIFSEK